MSGKVIDETGKPLRSIVVRTKTDHWFDDVITQTDEAGRFEIKVGSLPFDDETNQRRSDLGLLAFDPSGLQAGVIEIDYVEQNLDSLDNLEMKLTEQPIEWVAKKAALSNSKMAKFEKMIEQSREEFSHTIGQSVPNLASGTWLSTSAKSLDDFRGKYVLLDFWFIGCGPCARELPKLKLLQAIYGDLPFTIISVHSGRSESVENVRTYADQHSMSYPMVVDGPAMEIQKEFEPFGLTGYPHYILLDPEGKIVFNDAFLDKNSLRGEKFEIIREHLWRSGLLR